jgi:hypothetical protein
LDIEKSAKKENNKKRPPLIRTASLFTAYDSTLFY